MFTTIAAIVREPNGEFSLETVELDDLRQGEIRVRVEACGVCHTDAKYQVVVPLPAVFGHEGVGTVEEVGNGVTHVQRGDRVVMSYAFCGICPYCESDTPYLCENMHSVTFSGRRADGSAAIRLNEEPISGSFFQQSSFADHAITLERTVVPVRSDLPPEMLAAIPCGIQTGAGAMINTFDVGRGESVIVFGAGTVGLSAVMAAKMLGAATIICADLTPSRLELATDLGATHVLDVNDGEIPRKVKDILPRGAQYVFDASATIPALEDAMECIGQGGKIAIVSFPQGGKKFPFTTRNLFLRVASLQGTIQGHSVPRKFIPKIIEWQKQGIFPYEKLITTYDFANINQAFEDAESGGAVKPVLIM
jgi:aryl-alcohol dehydrogenase